MFIYTCIPDKDKKLISRDFSKLQQSLFSFWQNFDATRVELQVFEGCKNFC